MKKIKFLVLGIVLVTLSSCGALQIGGNNDPSGNQDKKPTDAGYVYSDAEFFKKSKTWAAYSDYNVCPFTANLTETKNGQTILSGQLNFNVDIETEHYYCDVQLEITAEDDFANMLPEKTYFQALIDGDEYWAVSKEKATDSYEDVTTNVDLATAKSEINDYYDAFISLLHFQGLPSGNFSYANTTSDEQVRITTNDHIQVLVNDVKYIEATGIILDVNNYGYYDHLEAKDWFGNTGTVLTISAIYDTSFSEIKHE